MEKARKETESASEQTFQLQFKLYSGPYIVQRRPRQRRLDDDGDVHKDNY